MPAKHLLQDTQIDFDEICQDDLPEGHKFRQYSSPALLMDDHIVFGTQVLGGGCSLRLPSQAELLEAVKPK